MAMLSFWTANVDEWKP